MAWRRTSSGPDISFLKAGNCPALAKAVKVGVHLYGRDWNGYWDLGEGDGKLYVSSAYGSRTVELGRRKPEKLAAELLEEIVRSRNTVPEIHQTRRKRR